MNYEEYLKNLDHNKKGLVKDRNIENELKIESLFGFIKECAGDVTFLNKRTIEPTEEERSEVFKSSFDKIKKAIVDLEPLLNKEN